MERDADFKGDGLVVADSVGEVRSVEFDDDFGGGVAIVLTIRGPLAIGCSTLLASKSFFPTCWGNSGGCASLVGVIGSAISLAVSSSSS